MIQRSLVAALAAVLVGFGAVNADAGWGSHGSHGSYGSYGSSGGYSYYSGGSGGSSGYSSYYASSGGSSGYGSYGSHRHVGPIRHLIGKIHDHFHAKRSHRSYYGSSGYASSGYSSYGSGSSHGSSGYVSYSYGSSGAYGSSGGASSGHGSSGHSVSNYGAMEGYIVPATPTAPATQSGEESGREYQLPGGAPEAAPAADAATAPPAEARIERDAAILTVSVPESAKVYVNDRLTTSEGTIRQFVSRGLMPGYTYTYVVRVEQVVDGEPVVNTQSLQLRAGAMERLVFELPQSDVKVAAQPAENETALTLEVPQDAVVTLAGNPTQMEGELRTFRTTQLAVGQVWEDYKVTVTVLRDGREVTREKVIQLIGGKAERIAFDFDEVTLASR